MSDDFKPGDIVYSSGPVLRERIWKDAQYFTPNAETDREVVIVLVAFAVTLTLTFAAGVGVGVML